MPVIEGPQSPTHELPHARFTSLATPSRGSAETSVWRVEIAAGSEPAPHSVTREEIFVVLSGEASVEIDGETRRACSGDAIVVPPDTLFSIANAGDTPLTLLCALPVGGQARLPDGEPFTPPWAL
ncbi:MAG: cupin domain-containing protein [Myxococcales bacterium]|nr:cupin domain-containing protein [Myxococcales bacterium]